jgi:hypothetical protein
MKKDVGYLSIGILVRRSRTPHDARATAPYVYLLNFRFAPNHHFALQGTWQFISAMLLEDPKACHILADDLESFLHVLSWVALQYMPHGLAPGALSSLLQDGFDASYEDEGRIKGGQNKRTYILTNEIPMRSGFKNQTIRDLLEELNYTFAARYLKLQLDSHKHGRTESNKHKALRLQYEEEYPKLSSSDWMVKLFKDAIANESAWPSDDASRKNANASQPIRERKRKTTSEVALPSLNKRPTKLPDFISKRLRRRT